MNHEYFGMGACLRRYIPSSMFVLVTQGVQIRILPGLKSWSVDFRLEIRRFDFIFTVTLIAHAFKVVLKVF